MRIIGSILLSVFVSNVALASTLGSWLWVNGAKDATMEAGQPAKLEFEIKDIDTGAMVHHFHEMHAKPMHLIVVSEDLSHFAHIHPEMKMHSMKPFSVNVNSVSNDPDNFALIDAVPFGGHFMLFGEVMPMDYGMLSFPYDLNVTGEQRNVPLPNVDQPGTDGKILKYFTDDGEIATEATGKYLLKLEVLPMDHCATILPRLHFELFANENGTYTDVRDLDPWLESYGHAIIIGRSGVVAADKAIFHLHAVWPLPTGDISKDERGPFVELTTHSHGKSMQTDHYHAWIQVKHQGKVHTFDFEIDWNLEQARKNAVRSPVFCLK